MQDFVSMPTKPCIFFSYATLYEAEVSVQTYYVAFTIIMPP